MVGGLGRGFADQCTKQRRDAFAPARRQGSAQNALWFAAAGAVYLFGGLVLTVVVHIPMNEALAVIDVPTDRAAAASIWAAYSPDWQTWNIARTGTSGAALLLAGIGLLRIS